MAKNGANGFPVNEESVRPFRLWDASKKHIIPYRAYKYPRKAHIGAFIEARFELKVGQTIEVFDIRVGELMGQYTRRIHTVAFTETRHHG